MMFKTLQLQLCVNDTLHPLDASDTLFLSDMHYKNTQIKTSICCGGCINKQFYAVTH